MNCQFPNCTNHAINGEYCIGHAKFSEQPQVEKKKYGRLRPMSKKTEEAMKTYLPRKKSFLQRPENRVCVIRSVQCTVAATTINHRKRRGVNLVNERYWEPCCNNCNRYIEQHSEWARQNGHLISVHQVERSIPVH